MVPKCRSADRDAHRSSSCFGRDCGSEVTEVEVTEVEVTEGEVTEGQVTEVREITDLQTEERSHRRLTERSRLF
jgi:hypothetical protein